MPGLEAPAEFVESSPEHSFVQELPLVAPPGPAALAQIRLHAPPEVRADVLQRNRQNLQRNNSYDRELPTLEEDNHFPAFVHLLPVVLPQQAPEPTLDELLRRVTERTDLQNVESVRLRVISYTISLSRLSLFLPRLQQLDLSGSVLSSLRDLGYGLVQLTQLNVSNCGLNSFDGTSGLPALRAVVADGNMIQRVGPLSELPLLQRLSARNNRISELGLLSFLGMCPNLLEVELRGNPVCYLPLYRATLQRSVPSLQLLDGQALLANIVATDGGSLSATTATDDDDVSSLSSELSSATSSQGFGFTHRPATAPQPHGNANSNTIISLRPASAVSTDSRRASLTGGTPLTGSVLGLVRRPRRHSGHAWNSSSSCSSAGSSLAATRPPSVTSTCSSQGSSLDMQSTPITFGYTSH